MKEIIRDLYFVLRKIFAIVPISCFIVLLYFLYGSFYSVVITMVIIRLIDALLTIQTSNVFLPILLFISLYGLTRFFDIFYGVAVNAHIFEKVKSVLNMDASLVLKDMELIDLEDVSKLNLLYRVDECVKEERLSTCFMNIFRLCSNLLAFIGISVLLTSYNPIIIVVIFASAIPVFINTWVVSSGYYKLKKEVSVLENERAYFWGIFTEKEAAKEMRVMCLGDYFINKWKTVNAHIDAALFKHEQKKETRNFLFNLIKISVYVFCVIFVFFLVKNNQIGFAVFPATLTFVSMLQNKLSTLIWSFSAVKENVLFVRDLRNLLDKKNYPGRRIPLDVLHEIKVTNLSFNYPGVTKKALDNINFCVKKGERIVIVGENGSGKTTLIKCMLGLYNTFTGDVLYDGVSIKGCEYDFNNVSVITQDFVRYQMSLGENVGFGLGSQPGIDNGVKETLRLAGFNKISSGEMTCATEIGSEFGGVELSGGEWQRIALARGAFKKSHIIVFDEPTAQLDPKSEYEILSNLLSISDGKTTIIVSHRMGLCKLVDKVILIDNTKLVDAGTHDELLSRCDLYSTLYHLQEKWYV